MESIPSGTLVLGWDVRSLSSDSSQLPPFGNRPYCYWSFCYLAITHPLIYLYSFRQVLVSITNQRLDNLVCLSVGPSAGVSSVLPSVGPSVTTVAFVKRPINWRNHFKCYKMVCFISYYKYKQVISTYISRMNMVVVAPSDSLSP